jgi:hypothetical protein
VVQTPVKTARHDLAALGHKALQQANVAVRDGVDLLGAELADLLAAEELAAAARTTAGTSATGTGGPPPGPPNQGRTGARTSVAEGAAPVQAP